MHVTQAAARSRQREEKFWVASRESGKEEETFDWTNGRIFDEKSGIQRA